METKAAIPDKRHLPNRLGLKGWVWAGRYTLERYLYTLHRVTGLGLLLYIALHLVANGFRLGGEGSWEATMAFVSSPGFKFGEYLVMAAFAFHALNGGRLILQHLGYTLGKPKPPVYPYVDSMRRRRPFTWAVMAGVVAVAIWSLIEFVT
jgi:succinate dehydrogenase / fumarate reductase cytochrome b subunit